VRQATRADVAQLARMLAAAFAEDPAFAWMLPAGTRVRVARIERFFAIELQAVGLARGSVWTTTDVAGAAISTPPGRWRLPPSAMLAHGPGYVRVFGTGLPRVMRLLARVERRHPREPTTTSRSSAWLPSSRVAASVGA
jgi:hypothetical protein